MSGVTVQEIRRNQILGIFLTIEQIEFAGESHVGYKRKS